MNEIKLAEDILIQVIDNEAVIVSPSGGMITTVNETGAFLIEYIKEKKHVIKNDLIKALQDNYDAPEKIITKDVDIFLNEMFKHKIIE